MNNLTDMTTTLANDARNTKNFPQWHPKFTALYWPEVK